MLRVVKRLAVLTALGAAFLVSGATGAEASELNLTGGSSAGTGTQCSDPECVDLGGGLWSFAGLLWETNIEQPTGSGYIDSFLRIEGTSAAKSLVVDGMNTSGELMNDEKSGQVGGANFTHDVLISDLQAVTVDGMEGTYYKFLLDINQEGGDPLLTLSGLQFCQSDAASVSFENTCAGDDGANPGEGISVLKYDMQFPTALPATCTDDDQENNQACTYDGYDKDQPGVPNRVLMDYSLNSGSGSGDLWVYVPTTLLPEEDGAYLYLWSQFGAPITCDAAFTTDCATNNDGYEEWAFLGEGESQIPGGEVPEPGSLVLLGTGLLFGGHLIRRRSRKQRAAKSE